MNVQRGDVVLVNFPYASGTGGKVRPAVVVQSPHNNVRLTNTILAGITSTTHRSSEPTQLFIDVSSSIGQQSGLVQNSAVTCENLATMATNRILRKIGSLPADAMAQVDLCLRAALGLN